jgi:hypothetical protein
MSRLGLALLLAALVCRAEDEPSAEAPAYTFRPVLRTGDRFTVTNVISVRVTTKTRQGDRETSTSFEREHKERFVDEIARGEGGVLEIARTYLALFTKERNDETDRPSVDRSPLAGKQVMIQESGRRRDVKCEERGLVDARLRRTVGLEIDWRDIFPRDPVRVGDAWKADCDAVSRRLAAYLDIGTKAEMRARLESVGPRNGSEVAKIYVDWTVEGMRDRQLFTKVVLAGDVYYDMKLRRVVQVDVQGSIAVRGAIIGAGAPEIVKGDGPVSITMTVKPAPVSPAAAPAEEDE